MVLDGTDLTDHPPPNGRGARGGTLEDGLPKGDGSAADDDDARRSGRSSRSSRSSSRRESAPGDDDAPYRRPSAVRLGSGWGETVPYETLMRSRDTAGAGCGAWAGWRSWLRRRGCCLAAAGDGDGGESVESDGATVQLRIPSRDEESMTVRNGLNIVTEGAFVELTTWCYRAPFLNVFALFLFLYFSWIAIFSLILYGCANHYDQIGHECVYGWDNDRKPGEQLNIIFSLSWTTFSTVGYGLVSPTIEENCTLLRFVCAAEAFVGVLFSGFCSAIIVSKVNRLHARAHVVFSSAVCLRFGDGVPGGAARHGEEEPPPQEGEEEEEDGTSSGSDDDGGECERPAPEEEAAALPFPVLEFRIANKKSNESHAEILNASASCMVRVHKSGGQRSMRESKFGADGIDPYDPDRVGGTASSPLMRSFKEIAFEPRLCPCFEKVWYLQHTLDERSPLVRPKVKDRIRLEGGWPRDLADHRSIRDEALVRFQSIVVTLDGTSNISAGSVFAKKMYKFDDIYIGWQFARITYLNRKQKVHDYDYDDLRVDLRLVHDILPQDGGKNEPLGNNQHSYDESLVESPRFMSSAP